MFTRQHYEALADVLARSRKHLGGISERWGTYDMLTGLAGYEALLIDTLEKDNPNFDPEKFKKAAREEC